MRPRKKLRRFANKITRQSGPGFTCALVRCVNGRVHGKWQRKRHNLARSLAKLRKFGQAATEASLNDWDQQYMWFTQPSLRAETN